MPKTMRGLTLLELMIVVVIVAVLSMIAYPSYREYSARAKRNEARAALLQIATMQERFYLQNNTYTNDMTNLGFSVANNLLITLNEFIHLVFTSNCLNLFSNSGYGLRGKYARDGSKKPETNFCISTNISLCSNHVSTDSFSVSSNSFKTSE